LQSKNKNPDEINYTFETERLIIRPLEEADRTFFIDLHMDEKIMEFNGGELSKKLANKKFDNSLCLNKGSSFLTFMIEPVNYTQKAGLIMLFRSSLGEYNLGIILSVEMQKRGFAIEASQEVINFGFSKLNILKIYANYHQKNKSSSHLFSKLGFLVVKKNISLNKTKVVLFNSEL